MKMKTIGLPLHSAPAVVAFRLSLGLIAAGCNLNATDWPRFRGPDGTGRSPDPIRLSWPTNSLPIAWQLANPDGYSSLAVAEGKLFTSIRSAVGTTQYCVALDAISGTQLWKQKLELTDSFHPPYSTPTFCDGRVYVYTHGPLLFCLDSGTGAIIWQRDLKREFASDQKSYGISQSPWVEDGGVFVSAVARTDCLFCFNATNGTLIWRGHTNSLMYASPIGTTIHGVRQIVFPGQYGLVSVIPATGEFLWRHCQDRSLFDQDGASPVFQDDIGLFVSTRAATAFRVLYTNGNFSTETLWTNEYAGSTYSTPVFHDGQLYLNSFPGLQCVDPITGKVKWQTSKASGPLVLVANHLLAQGRELVLAEASPLGYREVARTAMITGEFYNSPAVWNGRIYARSPDRLICYDASVNPSLVLNARLLPESHRLHLVISRINGIPFTNDPPPQVSLRWSPDVWKPLVEWAQLTNCFVRTNGSLGFEEAIPENDISRFYTAEEN